MKPSDGCELWRNLRVGDNVRVVRIPSFFTDPEIHIPEPEELRRLYERLIETKAALSIVEVDEFGHPWIEYEWYRDDGECVSHSLAINDDSFELAE